MDYFKKLVPQWLKNIYHFKMAVLANLWYGFPSRKIYPHTKTIKEKSSDKRNILDKEDNNFGVGVKVIGITGTNGKTTTCQMIAKILEENGYKVAMISTINFKLAEKEWVNKTKFTTLSGFAIQKFIRQAVRAGCEYLVLETSSHALDQYRVWGINYQMAVITNVTREHLDYHRTMDEYRRAKLKLFRKAETAVVNLDMEKPEEFLSCEARLKFGFTTSISNSQFLISNQITNPNDQIKKIIAEDIKLEIDNSTFKVQNTEFKIHLPGLFNVENALAAICVGLAEGISLEKISQALSKIQGVPGRLEFVPNVKGLNVIIDYAVTPDSLSKLYTLIQQINTNKTKVIAVFGACGERDRGKRPIMGEVVSRYANYIVLTNEDPYHENPWQIINEVALGVTNKKENETFWKIMDRREAIKKALRIAKPGDYVVVTGKGAEETMAVGDKRISWNDKKVVLEELEKISNS